MPYKNREDELAYNKRRYQRDKEKDKERKKSKEYKEYEKEYQKRYRALHREELDRKRKKRYYTNHEEERRKARIRSNRYWSNPINQQKKSEYRRKPEVKIRLNGLARIRKQKLKLEVLTYYSNGTPKCNCCGINGLPFLTLDHINNDGSSERKPLNRSYFYAYVKRQGFPDKYQVLCWNW